MHPCNCGNQSLVTLFHTPGQEVGKVFCENFKSCPEEQRTGVGNDEWLEFLREDHERPRSSRSMGVPWPVTSGLIELRGVQAEVEKRRDTQPLQVVSAASFLLPPAVLPTRRAACPPVPEASSVWSRTLGTAALVIFFAGGLLGVHAYHEARDRGGDGQAGTFTTPSPAPASSASAAPAAAVLGGAPFASGSIARAPSAPDEPGSGRAGQVDRDGAASARGVNGSSPLASGPALAAADEADEESSLVPQRRRSSRRHAKGRDRRERRERADSSRAGRGSRHDALARADVAGAAGADSIHDALARVPSASPSAPSAPSAAVLAPHKGQASGAQALVADLSKAGPPGSASADPGPSTPGVDRLLSQAAVTAPPAASLPSSIAALPPERISGAAVGRLSVQVAAKVRQCASRFGFARISLTARVSVEGATGRVSSLSLSDRFAGSPMEQCARRGIGSVSTSVFRTASQRLSVPVVVH